MVYWRVIAWESVESTNFDEKPGLVAWINGREPIRSDYFKERVFGDYIHTGYVDELPEDAVVNSWSSVRHGRRA
ncbi:hypothetical protein [Microbacterium sp. NPDC087589]|uniref:hypothetical protein n=1 Tax=Microbacterium sp. NPDC087589 TaxID=3364191 RepID=UPI0038139CD2